MTTPPGSTFATYSDSPRNPNRYLGQDYRFAPCYLRNRDPFTPQNASTDIKPKENQGKYPLGSLWLNFANKNMWLLVSLTAGTSKNLAEWTLISQGVTSGPVLSLSDTANTIVLPSVNPGFLGNIQLIAGAGTTIISNPGTNSLTISNVAAGNETLTGNAGGAVSPTAGNINTVGGTTIFTVGNPGTSTLTSDVVSTIHTILLGRGATTPSVPLANGTTGQVLTATTGADPSWQNPAASAVTSVTGSGNILAAPTTGAVVVSLVGTTNHAIQLGNASGSLTSASLLTNGQLLIGSNGLDPVAAGLTAGTGITITPGAGSITIATTATASAVQELTPDSGGAVTPTGSPLNITIHGTNGINTTNGGAGQLNVNGIQATTAQIGVTTLATNAQAINGTDAVNAVTSAALAAKLGAQTLFGLPIGAGSTAAINWTAAPTNGQLLIGNTGNTPALNTITAGAGIAVSNGAGSITITALSPSGFPWTDEAASFNASSNNGYFVTAVATATLPPTPSQGDVIRIVSDTASIVTILANGGQKIRLGNVISAAAGTAASTRIGDAMELVYRTADTTWYNFASPVGSWNIT
jgi:hypothetical protein